MNEGGRVAAWRADAPPVISRWTALDIRGHMPALAVERHLGTDAVHHLAQRWRSFQRPAEVHALRYGEQLDRNDAGAVVRDVGQRRAANVAMLT